jgi:hypothetical protein
MFLLQKHFLDVAEGGAIRKERIVRGIPTIAAESEDFPQALQKAKVWGAMVARAGDTETIFMSLGLTV